MVTRRNLVSSGYEFVEYCFPICYPSLDELTTEITFTTRLIFQFPMILSDLLISSLTVLRNTVES